MKLKHIITAGAILVAATACSDSVGPQSTRDRFVLVAAEGQPVPALVYETVLEDGHHVTAYALADTLWLGPGDAYTQKSLVHLFIDGTYGGRSRRTDFGSVTRDGATLRFESNFYENLAYSAVLQDSVLAVTQDLTGDGGSATLVLRRR